MKKASIIIISLSVLLTIINVVIAITVIERRNRADVNTVINTDTIRYVDTVKRIIPIPKDSTVLRYVTMRVRPAPVRHDTVHDSIFANIPIVQKVYSDSTYRAYVSGGQFVSLDSIYTFNKNTVITKTITQTLLKRRRFGIGINAGVGYGITSRAVEPYVGIGATYILW